MFILFSEASIFNPRKLAPEMGESFGRIKLENAFYPPYLPASLITEQHSQAFNRFHQRNPMYQGQQIPSRTVALVTIITSILSGFSFSLLSLSYVTTAVK